MTYLIVSIIWIISACIQLVMFYKLKNNINLFLAIGQYIIGIIYFYLWNIK